MLLLSTCKNFFIEFLAIKHENGAVSDSLWKVKVLNTCFDHVERTLSELNTKRVISRLVYPNLSGGIQNVHRHCLEALIYQKSFHVVKQKKEMIEAMHCKKFLRVKLAAQLCIIQCATF